MPLGGRQSRTNFSCCSFTVRHNIRFSPFLHYRAVTLSNFRTYCKLIGLFDNKEVYMNNNCTSLLLLVALLSYNNNRSGCNSCGCNNCGCNNCDGCNSCGCNNCGCNNNNGTFGNAGMLCLLLAFLNGLNNNCNCNANS